MIDLYFKIIDFIQFAKKLEYLVREKFEYQGKSIFRGMIDKKIPHEGNIKFEGENFVFSFHGAGIDFDSDNRHIYYNHYGGKDGLGVYFTVQRIFEDYNFEVTEEI